MTFKNGLKSLPKLYFVWFLIITFGAGIYAATKRGDVEATRGVAQTLTTPDDGLVEPIPRDRLPAIFESVLDEGDTIVKKFDAIGGLSAWVMIPALDKTQVVILYSMPGDEILLSGSLVTKSGQDTKNHTVDYLERYKPALKLDEHWARIEQSNWIRDGASDAEATFTMYGFFDANCVYCHLAWLGLEPYMQEGLQIRWIPVAVIAADSDVKAAALLASSDPAAAMRAGHEGWEERKAGAFASLPIIPPDVGQKLKDNLDLMRSIGVTGTPTFVFKDRDGQVTTLPGMPRLSLIPEITGIKAIANKNPRLHAFE